MRFVSIADRRPGAKTTLDTYGHLWPDTDDSTRAAIDAVLLAWRARNTEDGLPSGDSADRLAD
jgi:hypothetical protein